MTYAWCDQGLGLIINFVLFQRNFHPICVTQNQWPNRSNLLPRHRPHDLRQRQRLPLLMRRVPSYTLYFLFFNSLSPPIVPSANRTMKQTRFSLGWLRLIASFPLSLPKTGILSFPTSMALCHSLNSKQASPANRCMNKLIDRVCLGGGPNPE